MGAFLLAEDAMETDQKRRSWLVPFGKPTVLDWCWLILAALGLLALVPLLVTFLWFRLLLYKRPARE